jgi:hypothetical protein
MKKAITYSANLIKSANSVKWIFGLSFGQSGETPYLGGHSGPLKVNEACHFMHLAKIQGMKSISKPR